MSSSSDRGPGRPVGAEQETRELSGRVKEHARKGLSNVEIAALEHISVSYVKALKRWGLDEGSVARPRKPSPLRLTERAVAHHAVLAMRRDPRLRAFDPAKKLFWLDCVMEIHAMGDVDGLAFGADGDPFETHADFAIALGGKSDDLEHFLRRGLLLRLPEGGIDLPLKLGLKPKERPRNVLPGSGEQPLAQAFERSGDNQNEDDESLLTNICVPPISVSQRTQQSPQFLYPEDTTILPVSVSQRTQQSLAGDTETTTTIRKKDDLSGSSCAVQGAGEADTEIRIVVSSEDTDINSQRSAALALLVKAAAGYESELSKRDLEAVENWIERGVTDDVVLQAVKDDRGSPSPKPVWGLGLFTKPVLAAWKLKNAEVTANGSRVSPAPAAVLSPAETAAQARKERLRSLGMRALLAKKSQWPPTHDEFAARCPSGQETAGDHWLDVYEGVFDRGYQLPPFGSYVAAPESFSEDMQELEELLTGPGPPPEAAD